MHFFRFVWNSFFLFFVLINEAWKFSKNNFYHVTKENTESSFNYIIKKKKKIHNFIIVTFKFEDKKK